MADTSLFSGASNFVFAKDLHDEAGNWSYMRSHQADAGTEELGSNPEIRLLEDEESGIDRLSTLIDTEDPKYAKIR